MVTFDKFFKNKKVVYITLGLLFGAGVVVWYVQSNPNLESKIADKKIEPALVESIPQPLEKFEDFGLTIDQLKISTPIIPNVDGFDERIYYSALKKGVGQFKGSVTPDQKGNLFIFGHSASLIGSTGKYNEIFKDLNLLKEGDEFIVYYKKVSYYYKVQKSYETKDDDWTVIEPAKDKDAKTVTLMTCWPPGTVDKRWIVTAKQI